MTQVLFKNFEMLAGLLNLGVIDVPLQIMFTEKAVASSPSTCPTWS